MDWGAIEPAILGTLFERGLNPDMRSQLGAHYTDPATILKLIRPVIEAPLLAEWKVVKDRIGTLLEKHAKGGKGSKTARDEAQSAFIQFIQRVKAYRVLDPACGSGNFLYLALKTLKDLEHRANLEAEALGLHRELTIETSPANVLGIELNPYASELARVTVWIGEIQWMLTPGYTLRRDPILRPLDHIENRDAVLAYRQIDGTSEISCEPLWPEADAIVGNPPFLGDKKMRAELGDTYTDALRHQYEGRVPGGADFVTYWFEKARAQVEAGKAQRVGLVATNSIRGGASRKVLDRIVTTAPIFEAWSDEPWINNGAAVRVSLVCFGESPAPTSGDAVLDGQPVSAIHADLTAAHGAGRLDMTAACRLVENAGIAYQGPVLVGPFEVEGDVARDWLKQPNPNGRPNSEVLKPLTNGKDITTRSRALCVVDFGAMTEAEASLYEKPFDHVQTHVRPARENNRDESRRTRWWLHGRLGTDWRNAISALPRYIATTRVAKHRTFVWRPSVCWPSDAVVGIARSDDTTFGILQSRFHELWSLRMCTWLGVGNDPRYTPTTTFETFPFPEGLTPRDRPAGRRSDAIAAAAKKLNELRENWLNPPEWVDWVRTPEEEQAGFPLRAVAKAGHEADLQKRTLTNLYNTPPAWLDHAHRELDAAVAAAYGWRDYTPAMSDDEILKRLLAENLARAARQAPRHPPKP